MSEESNESQSAPWMAESPRTLAYATPHDPEPATNQITRGDMALLTVRIIGVYVLVQSLEFISTFYEVFGSNYTYLLRAAIPFMVVACLGIALLIFSRKLALWILPRTAVFTTEPPGNAPAQMQAIAFSIIGLLLVVWAMPWLVWLLAGIVFNDKGGAMTRSPLARAQAVLPSLLHYGAELGLGVWLFFGSKRLAAWWWQMRHPEFQHVDAATDAYHHPSNESTNAPQDQK